VENETVAAAVETANPERFSFLPAVDAQDAAAFART